MSTVELPDEGSMEAADNEESIFPFLVVPQLLGLTGFGQRRSKLNDGPSENPNEFQFPIPGYLSGCPKNSQVVAKGWARHHHVRQQREHWLPCEVAGNNECNDLGGTWCSLELRTHQIDVDRHRQCKFGCPSGVLQQRFCKFRPCTGNELGVHQVWYLDRSPAALARDSRESHQTVPRHRSRSGSSGAASEVVGVVATLARAVVPLAHAERAHSWQDYLEL